MPLKLTMDGLADYASRRDSRMLENAFAARTCNPASEPRPMLKLRGASI